MVHALDDLAGDIKLRFDIDHRAAFKDQVVVAFLDHFLDGLVQLRLELFEHVAVSRSLGFIEFLGEELEITGLLLELKLKALALGAKGCLMGKAFLYALAARGEAGVALALDIIRKELAVSLALTGANDVRKVTRDILVSS